MIGTCEDCEREQVQLHWKPCEDGYYHEGIAPTVCFHCRQERFQRQAAYRQTALSEGDQ